MRYYPGTDPSATVVDESGHAPGFGESVPGNHKSVGYDGLFQSINGGMEQTVCLAGLKKEDITGAGFGLAGYD